jgi:hypothetical protein
MKKARDFKTMTAIFAALFTGLFIWTSIQDGILKSAVITATASIPLVPLVIFGWRSNQKQIDKWAKLLALATDIGGT